MRGLRIAGALIFSVSTPFFSVYCDGKSSADKKTTTADVLARLQEAETRVKDLDFKFVQTTSLKVTRESQEIRGRAYFRRPDKFRVEHAAPRSQTVVSDGKTLWVHNPAANQVLTDSWSNWTQSAGFPRGLTPFQMTPTQLQERYAISLEAPDTGDGAILKLVPKDASAWPFVLRLWVDMTTGLPRRTEMESETLKTATRVEEARPNAGLADAVFTFVPPAGAEVFGAPGAKGSGR